MARSFVYYVRHSVLPRHSWDLASYPESRIEARGCATFFENEILPNKLISATARNRKRRGDIAQIWDWVSA